MYTEYIKYKQPTKSHSHTSHSSPISHPNPDAKTVTNFGDQSQIQRIKKKYFYNNITSILPQ